MSAVELIYWPGFSGRLQPIELLLRAAKVDYTINNDVPGFIGSSAEPVFACPILKDGDFVLSQTVAIVVYLAEKHGFSLDSAQDKAHALMSVLNLADVFTEGFKARREDDKGEAFLAADGRLSKWLTLVNGSAAKHGGKFSFGDKLTFVDFFLLNVHLSLVHVFGDDYKAQASKHEKITSIIKNIRAVPEIAEFIASDKFLPVLPNELQGADITAAGRKK
eukprot:CAMPEP_0201539736 /NCGR_PEP_ID=MMETSP0161_2-20130828/70564_1 /ASSEMBLY_ACC=CAM_ASM_000251 /TAXON_ID=180227 /ORGANISM="Neoparamoeba aestuarina, Strain SoJaBio B1-5/56/2" /LENGTH=219 /DNA_ID=CAMNT_0047947149 /DNA_START=849 /DNA_END=1508 /DNA_ORIENTATION=+